MASALGAGREFQPSPSFSGSIELILGPMFSGKTTELFRRIRRYTFANYRCIVIKYRKDQRYAAAGEASTHDQLMFAANPCERLAEAVDEVANFDVIGIDEGQFFPDLLEYSEKWANTGKVVIVSALDGTFQRKAFGRTLELIPLAEKVDKLRAVCMLCYGDASFTKRISTDDDRIEVIGGSEAYVSTCRKCFLAPGTGPIAALKHPGLFSPRARTLSHASSQSGSQTVTDTDADASSTSTPNLSPTLSSSSCSTPRAPIPIVSRTATAATESHVAFSSSQPPPSPSADKENFSLQRTLNDALPSPPPSADKENFSLRRTLNDALPSPPPSADKENFSLRRTLNDALPSFTDQDSFSLSEEVCEKISKFNQETTTTTTVACDGNPEVDENDDVPRDNAEERKDRANRSSRCVLSSVSTNK